MLREKQLMTRDVKKAERRGQKDNGWRLESEMSFC